MIKGNNLRLNFKSFPITTNTVVHRLLHELYGLRIRKYSRIETKLTTHFKWFACKQRTKTTILNPITYFAILYGCCCLIWTCWRSPHRLPVLPPEKGVYSRLRIFTVQNFHITELAKPNSTRSTRKPHERANNQHHDRPNTMLQSPIRPNNHPTKRNPRNPQENGELDKQGNAASGRIVLPWWCRGGEAVSSRWGRGRAATSMPSKPDRTIPHEVRGQKNLDEFAIDERWWRKVSRVSEDSPCWIGSRVRGGMRFAAISSVPGGGRIAIVSCRSV